MTVEEEFPFKKTTVVNRTSPSNLVLVVFEQSVGSVEVTLDVTSEEKSFRTERGKEERTAGQTLVKRPTSVITAIKFPVLDP